VFDDGCAEPRLRLRVDGVVCEAGGRVNEDHWGQTTCAAWVLDGATSLTDPPLLTGASDAEWFVAALSSALSRRLGAVPDDLRATLADVLTDVRGRFSAEARALPEASKPYEQPSASMALAVLRGRTVEIATIGDVRAVLRRSNGSVSSVGESNVHVGERQTIAELSRLLASGMSHREASQRLRPAILRHRATMNVDGGYWVLSTAFDVVDTISIRVVDADSIASIVLLSDGLYRLVDVFGRFAESEIAAIAAAGGLGGLYALLREIESADPECRTFPRVKPFDDATGVVVKVDEVGHR